jgi:hypothetical protein
MLHVERELIQEQLALDDLDAVLAQIVALDDLVTVETP